MNTRLRMDLLFYAICATVLASTFLRPPLDWWVLGFGCACFAAWCAVALYRLAALTRRLEEGNARMQSALLEIRDHRHGFESAEEKLLELSEIARAALRDGQASS